MAWKPGSALGVMTMAQTYFDDPRQLKIKDFVITDEFEIVDSDLGIKDAILKILDMSRGVLLVKDGEKVKGVVTERKILRKVAEAQEPMGLKVSDIMDTHILRIRYGEKVVNALEEIEKERPAAVIVVDKKDEFKGYFSPTDFIQAEKLMKEAKKRKAKDVPEEEVAEEAEKVAKEEE